MPLSLKLQNHLNRTVFPISSRDSNINLLLLIIFYLEYCIIILYHFPLYPLEIQQISNFSPCNNMIIFSKIRALNILLQFFLFIHTFFSLAISSNNHCYFNNIFHEFKVLKKVIITKMFNVDFHNKFIKFGLFCFLYFSLYVCVKNTKKFVCDRTKMLIFTLCCPLCVIEFFF